MGKLFTSESVTEGHPDKMCDQISDAILDAMLTHDPMARVAVETAVTTGQVHVMGEVTTSSYVDIPLLVRETVLDIGYDSSAKGFDGTTVGVNIAIGAQSPDIAQGVNAALEMREELFEEDLYDAQGAGDQGLVFGYANTQTPQLMPLPIMLAHDLARRLAEVRKIGLLEYLRPDGKTQATVEYSDGQPVGVETIVVSTQHDEAVSQGQIHFDVLNDVVSPVLDHYNLRLPERLIVNPTGLFIIGGPQGDAGLTGRKIIVDTYGGYARHGGGAFSGKDPSKVDRSAAYAARWAAKNVVAAGLADECEIQIAYAIGVARPVSIYVNTNGTEKNGFTEQQIQDAVNEVFDFRPLAILDQLQLRQPIYQQTAAYGHFGHEPYGDFFPWEQTNRVDALHTTLTHKVRKTVI